MKKRRVLVLMHEELVPPTSLKDRSEPEILQWRMEFDVMASLGRLGHEVHKVPVGDDLRAIREAIQQHEPHIAFNLLMHFHDAGVYDSAVVSWLELMKMPYSGCNPRGLLLASDKALSKKVLTYHRIRTPRFAVFPRRARVRRLPRRVQFPLIVKSKNEHASTGISQASIVGDLAALQERVEFIHRNVGTAAIAEEYIDGRELTIGVLGNKRLTTFGVWEMCFKNLPAGTPPIATSRVKWDLEYQAKLGISTGPAKELPEAKVQEITRIAKRVYRALDLSGYARIDLRMDEQGRVWVLEANPNADLSSNEDFALSAGDAGLDYDSLVQRLLGLGLAHQPAWMG